MKSYGYTTLLIVYSFFFLMTVPRAYGEMSLSTGVRYDWFTDNGSPKTKGYETTIPVGLTYRQKRFMLSLETAYSSVDVNAGADADAALSSFTDTRLSLSYEIPNLPVGIMLGVDMNLPTGKAQLSEQEKIAEVGDNNDLFEVDDFGEGLNAGLSIGLAKEFEKVRLGVNGAYLYKGEYDPSRDTSDDDFDPGDQILLLALLKWQASSQVHIDTFASYSYFAADERNGKQTFQEGSKVTLGGDFRVTRNLLGIAAGFQHTLQTKNEELGTGAVLERESENSNRPESFWLLDIMYDYSPRLSLRVLGNLKYYGESARKDDLSGLPVNGRRIRYSFGPGFIYTLREHLSVNGLAKYFIMTQKKDSWEDQDRTFRGVNLALGLIYTL